MKRTRPAWRPLLGSALFLIALVYVGVKLDGHLEGLAASAERVGAFALVGSILCMMLSLVFQAWYHLLILERLSDAAVPRVAVLASYFGALLVRYLPGKIWGLIYQSQYLASHTSPVRVLLANVFQSLMSLALTIGVAGIVFAAHVYSPFWLLSLLPMLLLIEILHRKPSLEMAAMAFLARWFPRLRLTEGSHMRPLPWHGTALLAAEWLAFLASFVLLLTGMLNALDATVLGVWYAGASLLSMVAVAVPAGIGVREAIFLSLPESSGHPVAVLALTAVLARIVQVAAELGLALLVFVVRRER